MLCIALRDMDSVKQPLQRMASFHRLALSAGIPNFYKTYLASIGNAQQEAIKANPIGDAIAELGNFDGTVQELVTKLKPFPMTPKCKSSPVAVWADCSKALSNPTLKRSALGLILTVQPKQVTGRLSKQIGTVEWFYRFYFNIFKLD